MSLYDELLTGCLKKLHSIHAWRRRVSQLGRNISAVKYGHLVFAACVVVYFCSLSVETTIWFYVWWTFILDPAFNSYSCNLCFRSCHDHLLFSNESLCLINNLCFTKVSAIVVFHSIRAFSFFCCLSGLILSIIASGSLNIAAHINISWSIGQKVFFGQPRGDIKVVLLHSSCMAWHRDNVDLRIAPWNLFFNR